MNWIALVAAVSAGVLFVIVAADPDYQPSRIAYLGLVAIAFLSAVARWQS